MQNPFNSTVNSANAERAANSPPGESPFPHGFLHNVQERSHAVSRAAARSLQNSGFSTFNRAFARRRIWKFRQQELFVTLFELAFVATGVWLLVRNIG